MGQLVTVAAAAADSTSLALYARQRLPPALVIGGHHEQAMCQKDAVYQSGVWRSPQELQREPYLYLRVSL
jgi:hypothetical protein